MSNTSIVLNSFFKVSVLDALVEQIGVKTLFEKKKKRLVGSPILHEKVTFN